MVSQPRQRPRTRNHRLDFVGNVSESRYRSASRNFILRLFVIAICEVALYVHYCYSLGVSTVMPTTVYSVSKKTGPMLHFQITSTNVVQYQQFMVHRIDIKVFALKL